MTAGSRLRNLGACREAINWVSGYRSMMAEQLWCGCERGDWMLWITAKLGIDRRLIVRAACACARLALVHVPAEETRPLRAIETAEAWCEGRVTINEVRAAAAAAANAAYARTTIMRECADLVRTHVPWCEIERRLQ